jgi:hypothetical protein
MGNLCGLTTSPGQILAIRQTIQQDSNGNPILELYQLEQAGNIIDGSGAWLTEVPMNLDYYVTNEFGEKTLSNDPAVGIPTKAKYRFKVKWQQPASLTEQTRRAYFLVPNVREYGWTSSGNDPNYNTGTSPSDITQQNILRSSYYFGLDWNGYTSGFTYSEKIEKLNEMIDCQDTFYEFKFNRVYTVSNLIDEYKKGAGRGRFLGIKEIDDNACESTVNKFPTNDGFKNFNLLFFLFSILMQILQIISIPLLIVIHVVAFVWNLLVKFKPWFVALLGILIGYYIYIGVKNFIQYAKAQADYIAYTAAAALAAIPFTAALVPVFSALAVLSQTQAAVYLANVIQAGTTVVALTAALFAFNAIFRLVKGQPIKGFTLPVLTYPDCTSCDCGTSEVDAEN